MSHPGMQHCLAVVWRAELMQRLAGVAGCFGLRGSPG